MMFLEKWIDFSVYAERIKTALEGLSPNVSRAVENLKFMGIGMLVIFIIIGVIILATVAVQKIFSKKD